MRLCPQEPPIIAASTSPHSHSIVQLSRKHMILLELLPILYLQAGPRPVIWSRC